MDLIGRYLKYIGNNKLGLPGFGDYFLVTKMEANGLFRLRDNTPECHWTIDNYSQSFELMPEGFDPLYVEPQYEIY